MSANPKTSVMPTFDELFTPLLKALRDLGGSGSIEEIYAKTVEVANLSEDVLAQMHDPEKSNMTEVGYRLAWARTYLKKFGLLENSTRGVWSLTAKGTSAETIDPTDIVKFVRANDKQEPAKKQSKKIDEPEIGKELPEEERWKDKLNIVLTQQVSPQGFERLVQRILRESGFVAVEVTGRTGDGSIDGKGIARINGFMSFHVLFQCKRYKGSVGSSEIRDFRGAMVGRADKGLFITTGTFTPAAVKEATRDGAPPIDLVDGDELAEKLRELSLGVTTELVPRVVVNPDWFTALADGQ
ncbi:restriction system protein [Polaromonas sp. OV174]|uniref:restriction endonuclease n=1 Tax=Polaromonas sp. OV174 TaxID=1855300 RepID=UPI0008F2088D|nr:restriction endonuclease [Polaromonas sp. OV174]SFC32570.1 restriction system protein [Polaromonas sp. OV174]